MPPREPTTSVVISYRRDDTAGHAGRLHKDLSTRFPGCVFIDIHELEPGAPVRTTITRVVGRCRVLLAVIGRQWLSIAGADGRRRLDDPEDFVRLEIKTALDSDIRVIPVLVEGASMPKENELPPELAGLAGRNALVLTDLHWDADVERLARMLEREIPECAARTRGRGRGLIAFAIAALLVLVAAVAFFKWFPRPSGNDNGNLNGNVNANVTPTQTPTAPAQTPQFEAVVTASEGRFVFPVDPKPEWQWTLPESPLGLEYLWEAQVENGGTTYYISAYYYKFATSKPGRGNLAALSNQLGKNVTFNDPKAGKQLYVEGVQVRAEAGPGTLTLVVTGGEIGRLFSGKPSQATLKYQVPGQAESSHVEPIRY